MRIFKCSLTLLLILAWLARPTDGFSQASAEYNLPSYDEKPIHYGFLIGIHSSIYRLKYADIFQDSVNIHSIMPNNSAGFSLGFVGNLRLGNYFDLRITPAVGFYELKVDYNYVNRPKETQAVSTTNVELPLLIKYKSERRKNLRMYLIGGAKFAFEASGRNQVDESVESLTVKNSNIFVEFGFGLDIYYPLFKFSPEIRFSKGLLNILDQTNNQFTSTIDRLSQNTITLYLIVQ